MSRYLESAKVPQVLRLVASISAILGPSWKLSVLDNNPAEWADAAQVSWYPNSSPDTYPIAVDFVSEMGGVGPVMVQVVDADHYEITPAIREKIDAVIDWCQSNNVLHGFDQT